MRIEDFADIINAAIEAIIKTVEMERRTVVWTYKGPAVYVWGCKFTLSQCGRDHHYDTVEEVIAALPNLIREGIEKEEHKHDKA